MKGNGLKIFGVALAVIVGIALICVFYSISTKNSFISMKEDINQQQANVEVALQRRADLIPNLVATVKGYATHEEKVFTEIAEASDSVFCVFSGSIRTSTKVSENSRVSISGVQRKIFFPQKKARKRYIRIWNLLLPSSTNFYVPT